MKLHLNKKVFEDAIQATSIHFKILPVFIEKDYWITLILKRLANSQYCDNVVFKGGTSLSKGYRLIDRFSEDIDLSVLNTSEISGNQTKSLIRGIEKAISFDLTEIEISGITSKGSQFRKTVFSYPSTYNKVISQTISNKMIIEINSFSNPYPYEKLEIKSLISDFIAYRNSLDLIKIYNLEPFVLNVLEKPQTMLEKIVSLIRFSFAENPVESLSEKIRHFYDIHFLYGDVECRNYIESPDFFTEFINVLKHDQEVFDDPPGWKNKKPDQSPLINDFASIWQKLKLFYSKELSMLAFSEVPHEKDVFERFERIMKSIKIQL